VAMVWVRVGAGGGCHGGLAQTRPWNWYTTGHVALDLRSIGAEYWRDLSKEICEEMDLRTGTAVQTAAAAVVMWIISAWLETGVIDWTGEFIFAFIWLVFVLSLGAIILLLYLIRRGHAARVSSLFFLVPPVTAIFSYFIFNETFGPVAVIGILVAVIGVVLVNRFS
jgi:drug/metabolite transporter (DMT)-like permease